MAGSTGVGAGRSGLPSQRFAPGELRALIAMALAMTVVEGVRPTASYRALELGAGAFEIGLIAGAFAVLAFLAALPLGRAVDRRGEQPFMLIGAVLLIVAALVGLSVPSLIALVIMQAMLGLGHISLSVSMQTFAGNGSGSRDLRFARLSVAVAVGHFIGPFVAGRVIEGGLPFLPNGGGTVVSLGLASVVGVACITVLLTGRGRRSGPAPQRTEPVRIPVSTLLRIGGMPRALYVGIVAMTTLDLYVAYLPVVGLERGIRPSVIGYLLATRAAFTVLSRLSMGPLLMRFGRRYLLMGAMGVCAVAVSGLALPFIPVPGLFLIMAVAGFWGGVGMPMTTAWVADRAPAGARGVALGLRLTGNRVSQVIVPIALGGVAATFGAGSIFLVAGAAFGVASGLVRNAPLDPEAPSPEAPSEESS